MEESIKTPDRPEDGRDGSLGMNAGDRCGQAWEEAGKNTGRGSLLAAIKDVFPGKQQDIRSYSPLTLAYIGDVVYDLIIRTVVVSRANRPVNDLHRITVRYVSAGAQSRIVQTLMDSFTEEEQSVYRRGKNSKPHTTAKNASVSDYLKATGLEAVIGYLYLTDNMERALYLVKKGIELAGLEI
nr:ribonuclease III domain-containing protein [uncultured Acetatifactor sp.]